jgi:hypothetical protein
MHNRHGDRGTPHIVHKMKESAAEFRCAPMDAQKLVAVIVVVLVPIVFGVPSLTVFIPPAMAMFPAPFPCGSQRSALFGYLGAVPAMFLSGFVQIVININNALLAVLSL